MLSFAISVYIYAILMWYIFYQVPKRFGVVSRRTMDALGVGAIDCDSSIVLDEENVKTVVRLLDHDRRFTRKQQLSSRKDSECDSAHPSQY